MKYEARVERTCNCYIYMLLYIFMPSDSDSQILYLVVDSSGVCAQDFYRKGISTTLHHNAQYYTAKREIPKI